MEAVDKLRELNVTADEVDRLTKAFKDEKFREMLRDYAEELSDPENKKRYEEEIKLLEQERGNTVLFIHPEPFRALRTSVNGEQKCFINICASEDIGKPDCTLGVSEEGRKGQRWSLPHSLHPGRQDTDSKGKKTMIYDVVFHPDTLRLASKSKAFMDMVESTAIQGIQNAFNVTLDKNNVREMRTRYKGTPQPCVIRKPIPGYVPKEPSEEPDPLAFPYPEDKRPPTSSQNKPPKSHTTKNSSNAEPKSFQIQTHKNKEPTEPKHTVKYVSFIDLQDFRCSRDSAQSPRPKQIVVIVDMPLLKAAADATLEVNERRLQLESKKPAYRLELLLAYPVDEDKGEAKFNKERGQLTVTLPVLPSNEGLDFAVEPSQTSVSDDERQRENRELEEEEEERNIEETRVEKGEEEEERGQEKGEGQMREGGNSEEGEKMGNGVEEERVEEQKEDNEKGDGKSNLHEMKQHEDKEIEKHNTSSEDGCGRVAEEDSRFQCHTVDRCTDVSLDEENSHAASPETENQPVFNTADHSGCTVKEKEEHLCSSLESTPKIETSDVLEDAEKTKGSLDGNLEVEPNAAFLHHSSGEAVSFTPADTQCQSNVKDCCTSQKTEESSETPASGEANKSSGGSPSSLKQEDAENINGDDSPTEKALQKDKPPPALLREIDEDGNEKVISDHCTSAGFTFQNSLMYELD